MFAYCLFYELNVVSILRIVDSFYVFVDLSIGISSVDLLVDVFLFVSSFCLQISCTIRYFIYFS